MKSVKKFKIEWGLSLLNKYSLIVIEEELSHLKLTKTQVLFLIHLKQRNWVHQDYLAEMFKMNRSTVTRAVNHLEGLGYVAKVVDVNNKKANFLSLTKLGEEIFKEVEHALSRWLDIATADFSEEEIEQSINLITRMASNACKHLGDDYLSEIITRTKKES